MYWCIKHFWHTIYFNLLCFSVVIGYSKLYAFWVRRHLHSSYCKHQINYFVKPGVLLFEGKELQICTSFTLSSCIPDSVTNRSGVILPQRNQLQTLKHKMECTGTKGKVRHVTWENVCFYCWRSRPSSAYGNSSINTDCQPWNWVK